jgi:hypothetical protein
MGRGTQPISLKMSAIIVRGRGGWENLRCLPIHWFVATSMTKLINNYGNPTRAFLSAQT